MPKRLIQVVREQGQLSHLRSTIKLTVTPQDFLPLLSILSQSGGILVCCEHGVIIHDGKPREYWVPYDRYKVVADKDTTFPIPPEHQSVCDMVLAGTFDLLAQRRRIFFSKYINIDIHTTGPVKRNKGCSCKNSCKGSCGCKRKGVNCHSGCSCPENCVLRQ